MDLINAKGLYESVAKNLPEEERERFRVSGKDLVIGQDYDKILITYPSSTTEQYLYEKATVTILTILVTYSTAAKKDLTQVEVL